MSDDFHPLDAWLRESAARPPAPRPRDFRPAVFAEISRRRAASPWRRFLAWLDFSEPFYAPRPQRAALALAFTLVIAVALPGPGSPDANHSGRALRALRLDSFAAPPALWPLAR